MTERERAGVVSRLRAEADQKKRETAERDAAEQQRREAERDRGRRDGERWAIELAPLESLKRFERATRDAAYLAHCWGWSELVRRAIGKPSGDQTAAYAEGFAAGALAVYDQVKQEAAGG